MSEEMEMCINHPTAKPVMWTGHIHRFGKVLTVGYCKGCEEQMDKCDMRIGCLGIENSLVNK